MPDFTKREVITAAPALAGALAIGRISGNTARAEIPAGNDKNRHVTHALAKFIVEASYAGLPKEVRAEAARTLLNWMGAAIGGSRTKAVGIAVASLSPFFGPANASLIGRSERCDGLNAGLINGIAGHILDFDDDHLKTVIHPAVSVLPALLACAEHRQATGEEFMTALIVGMEVELRIGNAVSPNHYDAGWHITGSCGVFGAAAACGKILGLDDQRMTWALGLAASQPVGLRESFGSMNKSFNPGRASSNGLLAAVLAAHGFTSSDGMLEAKAGWAATVSTKWDERQIVDGLGMRYETSSNTYKPFSCGIVMHPAIEAAIRFNKLGLTPQSVNAVEITANPLVLTLTGKTNPQTGLEGKFSIYHAVAIAFIQGDAGTKQFSDAAVLDPAVIGMRGKIKVIPDPAVGKDQVRMTVISSDGHRFTETIEHAIGSEQKPMSDRELEKKFRALADGILPANNISRLINMCMSVANLKDVRQLAIATTSDA